MWVLRHCCNNKCWSCKAKAKWLIEARAPAVSITGNSTKLPPLTQLQIPEEQNCSLPSPKDIPSSKRSILYPKAETSILYLKAETIKNTIIVGFHLDRSPPDRQLWQEVSKWLLLWSLGQQVLCCPELWKQSLIHENRVVNTPSRASLLANMDNVAHRRRTLDYWWQCYLDFSWPQLERSQMYCVTLRILSCYAQPAVLRRSVPCEQVHLILLENQELAPCVPTTLSAFTETVRTR